MMFDSRLAAGVAPRPVAVADAAARYLTKPFGSGPAEGAPDRVQPGADG